MTEKSTRRTPIGTPGAVTKYYLLTIPDYTEPTLESFSTKEELIGRMQGFVGRSACVYAFRGEQLNIGLDRGTKQLFVLEEGHLPVPILASAGMEVISNGRLGGDLEPDADYLAATKCSHEPPKSKKRASKQSVDDEEEDYDDDEL